QVGASEKPDIVTAKMLEGRVAIIVDGSPTILTAPFVLFESYQASEDYYLKSYRASLIRMIRILAMFTAIMLPATYVAFQQFQYQMLPFKILVSIIDAVSTIPMSPALEMMIMLIMFEILSETSIRMPRYIGMALSIMGAIVLGETAVRAGIVSSPTILVTALSTIGIFCVPDESNAASLLRLVFCAIGGVLGIFGIVIAGMFLIAYLCTLESFGVSYCAPLAPMLTHDWQDAILKDVTGKMTERPYTIPTVNRRRVKNADAKSKNK
ncbi:MAG: spore germination protein, partial [Clostridia bacterium]